ncbi:beta-propeller fold lactonase family protein [Wenzhouxiangella marina]|uniref:beta-propeller fold lactonase family protein n=1 Tax=Wenzhouxiangella marina TaxID=1579979 RepID=UPI00146FCE16|nr:beta-propeller fold lactonase family protein [Wenzhouxiangella marina]
MTRLPFLFAALLLALAVQSAQAILSEPDHLLYGQITWFGDPVADGELTLHVPAWTAGPIARYRLGTEAALGSGYALRVPMNSVGARIPGTAREGDEALVYLDDELIAMIEIGGRGVARRLDLDPEYLQGLAALSIDDIEVPEGNAGETSLVVFTVTLGQALESTTTFSWSTADGSGPDAAIGGSSCDPGIDYLQNFGTGTILPGNLETVVGVTICGNDDPDGDRQFEVHLSNPSAEVGLLKPVGIATILDNNTVPELAIEDITVSEPPVGNTTQAVFRVSLSEAWTQPVSVDWTTANGTAIAGQDYVADSGTLLFAAGQVSRQIPVTILANPSGADQRDFFVNLSNPVQASIADGSGQGIIVDSEQTLVFVESQQNGVNVQGMSDPASVAVSSPDGAHVYVASRTADELVVFARDPATGSLSAMEVVNVSDFLIASGRAIEGINGFADLVLDDAGQHIYAVAQTDGAVVTFTRDDDDGSPDFGRLAVTQVLFNGDQPEPSLAPPITGLTQPRGVAVSPDGDNVYLATAGAPGHVLVFSRDPLTGELLFRQDLERGAQDPLGNTVEGIGNASSVVVSTNNARVYVAGQSDDAIAVFNRNLGDNGRLSYRNRVVSGLGGFSGFQAPSSMALSPGGQQLYVTGRDSNSLAVLQRQGNGDLAFLQAVLASSPGIEGLEEPLRVTVSPDGQLLYVVSTSDGTEIEPGTLTVLRRQTDLSEPDFGQLSYEEVKRNNLGGVIGLWGASGVAVSPDNAHIYVAARFDQAVTVFARDLQAPINPTLVSTSHEIGTWNSSPIIDMSWSGAEDLDPSGLNPGSGIEGYSIEFSLLSITQPDDTIDVVQSSDPHSASSAALVDSMQHWFHLRTCDNAGNCSDTVSVGPYWIDATAPTGPSDLASSTHIPGDPAIPDNVVSVSWTAAIDAGDAVSGLAGYSYVFNQSPTQGPNETLNLPDTAVEVDSEVLPDGLWYFHIRPIDVAGNVGESRTIGPFAIGSDQAAPTVFSASAVAAPDGGVIVEGGELVTATTQLMLQFDKPMNASASNLANYRLYDGFLSPQFVDCSLADDGLMAGVEYIGEDRLAVIDLVSATGLPAGDYTLAACADLQDFNGNGLDGDGDGVAGDAYSIRFSVAWDNLAPNPNFDSPLAFDNWSVNEPAYIALDATSDAGSAPRSGAVRIVPDVAAPTGYAVTRCVQLPTGLIQGYAVQSRVRISDPIGDPNPVEATTSMTFYSADDCTGLIQAFVSNDVLNDTGDAWRPMSASVSPGAVGSAGSALVSLNLDFPGGAAFPLEAWFDDVHFFAFAEDELPTEAPQVVEVYSSHATEYGGLSVDLATEASITQLIPEFSRGVFTDPGGLDPEAANNVANYRLFSLSGPEDPGPDGCSVAGDLGIASVSYQAAQKRAVVRLADSHALPQGFYRLAVCGTIRDFDNNYLDGQGDGTQGSDYQLDFEVGTTNLLANPNLDSTLGQWSSSVSTGVGELRWSAADRNGLLSSGSSRVQHSSGTASTYTLSQCVGLDGLTDQYALGAFVLTNQAFGDAPTVTARATFHDAASCGGSMLDTLEIEDQFPHSAGVWQPLLVRLNQVPAGSVSARVEFVVTTGATVDAPVDVWLDTLTLRSGLVDQIFRSRFTPEY